MYQLERLGSYYYPYRLQRDAQGNVLALGGDLLKLSPQGDSLWSHSYLQYGRFLGIKRVVELPNGQYLAAGTRYNGFDRDVGFVLTDHNGVLLRDTLLVRNGSDEDVAGVALTPGNDYVLAGWTNLGPIGGADQYWFSYRSWARLLPTRSGQPTPQTHLLAYPNPTTDALTLVAADEHRLSGTWALTDGLGRPVQTGTLAGLPTGRLSLAGLPRASTCCG